MKAVRKVEDFLWKLDNGGCETESASEQEVDKGLRLDQWIEAVEVRRRGE